MTEEDKLIKEATETVEWQATPMIDRPLFVHGYVTGAKSKLTDLNNAIHLLRQVVVNYWDDKEMYGLQQDIKRFLEDK